MGAFRSRLLPLPRILKQSPWPLPTARASCLDTYQPIEEEMTPYYDPARFYPARLGEVFNKRYQLVNKVGFGASSTIWLARDLNQWRWGREKYVTLKLNASSTRYLPKNTAEAELSIYKHIAKSNSQHEGWHFVRQLIDSFAFEKDSKCHSCLVFEPLREPLWVYQTRFPGEVIPTWLVKIMLHMILKGLHYLHSDCRIIHADLKPDNIMVELEDASILEQYAHEEFENPLPQKTCSDRHIIYLSRNNFGPPRGTTGLVKIIDFDHSVFGDKSNSGCIQTEIYRAPEVIVNAGYGYSADIWSLGVMLWDLLEGEELFKEMGSFTVDHNNNNKDKDKINGDDDDNDSGYDEMNHLGQITALLGPAPLDLLHSGKRTSMFYEPNGKLKNTSLNPREISFENTLNNGNIDGAEKLKFVNFVKRMLKWKPEERSTAKELLDDPWLDIQLEF